MTFSGRFVRDADSGIGEQSVMDLQRDDLAYIHLQVRLGQQGLPIQPRSPQGSRIDRGRPPKGGRLRPLPAHLTWARATAERAGHPQPQAVLALVSGMRFDHLVVRARARAYRHRGTGSSPVI